MDTTIFLSVALPAFNEGARLPRLLKDLVEVGQNVQGPAVEFVISDDGSRDEDAQSYAEFASEGQARFIEAGVPHRMRCLRAPRNAGKGAAIRRAWASATPDTQWLAFLDSDGAISGGEFWRLAAMLSPEAPSGAPSEAPFDVLAASRVRMAGHAVDRKLFRHLQGRVFATFTEQLFGLGFYDTQCGLKFARAPLIRAVLGQLVENRWLIDVELLVLLQRQGARMREEPINWFEPGGSKVRFGIDPLRMFEGLVRMRARMGPGGAR